MKYILYGLLTSFVIILGFVGYQVYIKHNELKNAGIETEYMKTLDSVTKPLSKEDPEPVKPKHSFTDEDLLNILLLGIDRRNRNEPYRTDIMILLTINNKDKKVVMTSIPRDLWINGSGRINGIFNVQGPEAMLKAFSDVTGQKVNKYILTDFKDFSWLIDAMGGVTVNVDRTFTDNSYPIDETFGIQTVNFTQGEEKLTGERALIFARSRKGNNGEGSDWARMERQHKILKGMVNDVQQPNNLFTPMNIEQAYKTVTEGKMDTNLTLGDAYFLWSFYDQKDEYEMESFFVRDFMFNPPLADYGGAWVLRPKGNTFSELIRELNAKLTRTSEVTTENIESPTESI
jgi:LCP family protein required for cell wall assembly